MSNVIIQDAEFKAGEYGEFILHGDPFIEGVFFDFYPKGLYGEPKEARYKETGLGFEPPVWTPDPASPNEGGGLPKAGKTQGRAESEPREGDTVLEPEGLEESFAEPRMVLYVSNSPRDGWKKIGDFKSHIYQNTNRVARFFRVIHPVGCPFEGKVIAIAR